MLQRAADRLRLPGILAGVALIALALLGGCASVDPVVKVALVAPFEGRHRPIGYDAIYSARLAVREINEAGGIDGHRVALVAVDDGGTAQGAIDAARTLVVDPAVVGVVGHWLPDSSAAAAPLYEEAGLTHILAGAPPFEADDGEGVSAEFRAAYTAVTPFDEQPGSVAYPTYLAFQALFDAMARTARDHGTITRQSMTVGSP